MLSFFEFVNADSFSIPPKYANNLAISNSKLNDSSLHKNRSILNCLNNFFEFGNPVRFRNLNISLYEFQQIINLKAKDTLYFGKKIAQEGSGLVLTCVKRYIYNANLDWYLNSVSIDKHYSNKKANRSKNLIQPYRIQEFFCKDLNITISELVIKKVDFLNSGDYHCSNNDANSVTISDKNNNINDYKNLFNFQVLIIDWEEFNLNFLNTIYYDILNKNRSLVKRCPLLSPTWYKWSTNLNVDKPSIHIKDSGRYFCKSKSLDKQVDFYIFSKLLNLLSHI